MKCFQSMMLPFKDSCQQDGGWNCLLAQFDTMTFGLKIVIKQLIKTQTYFVNTMLFAETTKTFGYNESIL